MRTLLFAVLLSFAAVCANAQSSANAQYSVKTLRNNMKFNAALKPEKNIEFNYIDYSQFTSQKVYLKQDLAFQGKTARVSFFYTEGVIAYSYLKTSRFTGIDVALDVEDADLEDNDPHHAVPVFAYIKVLKNDKVLETGKVQVFTVERLEILNANQSIEPAISAIHGDPHSSEVIKPANRRPSAPQQENPVVFEDKYHSF